MCYTLDHFTFSPLNVISSRMTFNNLICFGSIGMGCVRFGVARLGSVRLG